MRPADLYTQTRAETVNNGTHTHKSNVLKHTLPYERPAVNESARNYRLLNTCAQHACSARGAVTHCDPSSARGGTRSSSSAADIQRQHGALGENRALTT